MTRSDDVLRHALFAATVMLPVCALSASALETNIDQRGLRFSQTSVTLAVGDTLRFHNSDDVIHNIMVINSDDIPQDQGLQKPGEVIAAKFEEAGTFQVRCAIHPKMKMRVSV